jgi:hypothetical protein
MTVSSRLPAVLALSLLCCSISTTAEVFCSHKTSQTVTLRKKCKFFETKINLTKVGVLGPTGATGSTGVSGANGQLRIYGDSSAGAKTVSSSATFSDTNLQYTNFTVDSGVTLTVPSGMVIRCSGTFTNNGTIAVLTSAEGGNQFSFSSTTDGAYSPAEPGVSLRTSQSGEFGSNSTSRGGGAGGIGVGDFGATAIFYPGLKAGGGGGGGFSSDGGDGGGSFTVIASGAIVNAGTINADGESKSFRSGGGGGGIVILASAASVTNSGTVTANGGNGGASDTFSGVGGGGGGGIVRFIAPTITGGTVTTSGGTSGTPGSAASVTTTPRQGGGGGGACAGNGGSGGLVNSSGTPTAGTSGGAGIALQTLVDPTALF